MDDNKVTSKIINKIVQYQAMRDHSPKELAEKLSKFYSKDEVAPALEKAIELGYILETSVLSKKVADQLDRKYRGILYINRYLSKKGLPLVKPDWDLELEKARRMLAKKIKSKPPYSLDQKKVAFRFLAGRGFAGPTCNKAIHEAAR